MKIRRIIYLTLIAFLIIYLFGFYENNSKSNYIISSELEIEDIMVDFKFPDEVNTNEEKKLYFPIGFRGQAGEVFYLVVDKNIYKYKLVLIENKDNTILTYELKDSYDNLILPKSKFFIYEF